MCAKNLILAWFLHHDRSSFEDSSWCTEQVWCYTGKAPRFGVLKLCALTRGACTRVSWAWLRFCGTHWHVPNYYNGVHRTWACGSRGEACGLVRHRPAHLPNVPILGCRGLQLAAGESPQPDPPLVCCLWHVRGQRLPSSCGCHRMATGGKQHAQQTRRSQRNLPSC